ncbi:hypothetical protein RN607_13415 [Demequina capsici]|uniref:DUF2142 domain-containing protein n=1 Tax=Demequina capsici TaxID=3075620 RepID=A0AA96FCM0_9MICO|nr:MULTISPECIES: hypothetical protein [unclassified Demequina]WNM24362.1 hypothetical protein RN606_13510 [Demequina sp. OYTSA14]WNM27184.1 hypothetical protein RN607_13415 [Demequina sp. PMTSA13]
MPYAQPTADRDVVPVLRARWWEHLALVLLGVGGPFAYAAASPVYSSGDEAAHVDYAYQVWHGTLPVFEKGLVLMNTVGAHPPVQWTAQHPPLTYVLLAPIVGPLVDAGYINAAAMAGRMLMVVLSVGLLYAVRAGANAMMPKVRHVGIAAAAVVGLSVWFVRLGGSVYNDMLAALLLATAFAAAVRLVKGLSGMRAAIVLVIAVAAASTTRLSSVPLAAVIVVLVLVSAALVRRPRPALAWWTAAAAGLAALASSGWFYLRNLEITGSISGGHPEWAADHTSRVARPPLEVAFDASFWAKMLQQFSIEDNGTHLPGTVIALANLLLFALPVAVGLVLVVARALRRRPVAWDDVLIASSAVGIAGGIAAMQVLHTAGGGSVLPRYFFAMIPFLAPYMAFALLRGGRLRPALLAWLAVRSVLLVIEVGATLSRDLYGAQARIFPVAAWVGVALALAGVGVVAAGVLRDRQSNLPSAASLS